MLERVPLERAYPEAFATRARLAVRIGQLQLWPTLCNDQCVDREFPLFPVKCEFEPVRQQLLQHRLQVVFEVDVFAGHSIHIVLIRCDPCRPPCDLLTINPVRHQDEVSQRRVVREKVTPIGSVVHAVRVRLFHRLDRRRFKLRRCRCRQRSCPRRLRRTGWRLCPTGWRLCGTEG